MQTVTLLSWRIGYGFSGAMGYISSDRRVWFQQAQISFPRIIFRPDPASSFS